MTNDLIQLHISAQILLAGVFPLIIIGLGVAYGIKQWRAARRQRREDDQAPH